MGVIDILKRFLRYAAPAVILSCSISAPASAEDYGSVQGYWHSFNNGVDVYTGVFALNKDVSLDTSTYLKYNIDLINPSFGEGGGGGGGGDSLTNNNGKAAAVSGASSAVTAGGSSSKDTRHDFLGGVTHNFNNVIGVEAYYEYSREKDYSSHTPTITLKKDLFEKNTTVTAGFSRNYDRISGQFAGGTRNRDTNNYFFGVTQVLSPFTVAQIGYSRSDSSGFESEGIRLVPINGVDISTCTAKSATCVDEAFPSSRKRNAYIAGLNHYFLNVLPPVFDRSAVRFNYRYYDDNWKITSHTAEVEYHKYLTEDLILRLNYRYYTQSKAYFVKDTYTGAEEFLSSSPQLLKLNSNLAGVKLTYNIKADANEKGLRAGSVEGKYEYYTESIGVNAHVIMAGVRIVF